MSLSPLKALSFVNRRMSQIDLKIEMEGLSRDRLNSQKNLTKGTNKVTRQRKQAARHIPQTLEEEVFTQKSWCRLLWRAKPHLTFYLCIIPDK